MGTTKLHHRHSSHSRESGKIEMDTYIPPYSILHRLAPPPSDSSLKPLENRLEAPQNRRTDLQPPQQPYSPTTLAERLGLPPLSPVDPSSATLSPKAAHSIIRSKASNSRKTPYTRESPKRADVVRTTPIQRKKGDYKRPSAPTTPFSPRTSSVEDSHTSSGSPPRRTTHETKSLDYMLPRHSVNLIPVSTPRWRPTKNRARSETKGEGGWTGITPDDSGFGMSLADRISPPFSTTELPASRSFNSVNNRDFDNHVAQQLNNQDISPQFIPSSQQRTSTEIPRLSSYVYEPRRSTSISDDAYEEGELVEDDEKGSSRGTKVIISNLEPGTTTDDVAAVFNQFGEIIGASTSPTFSGDLDEESILLVFASAESASRAISEMNGVLADGRRLSVALAG
ncbi:hypothetical protein P389DRAFT_198160 [Cystobasidium minutum MCA 4210]|uniref:uncharacterized protein n=1 Tax=Cystobasidium minutum MCA 4210 TaxID=1397322 RepID=UPI0034CF04E9|eukprot:jgi/Rhomi1/198160/gm1.6374_g